MVSDMDLGKLVSMEGGSILPSSLAYLESEPRGQKGIFGDGLSKQARSCFGTEEHDLRGVKMARSSSDGERMLSFSSTKQDALLRSGDGTLPFYSPSTPPAYSRNAGFRGPFTLSQWMELEQQALIYKYIVAHAPIPPNLLFPIRRSLYQPGFPLFSAGSYGSNSLGWGSFHLGYSGNADPEPGRCRRTDGKKWRCSRDAVADGKYCERHMNRGRHRSRKHVEGQNGHAAKAMPAIAPSPSTSLAVTGGGSSNTITTAQQHSKNFQASVTDPSPVQFNRTLVAKETVKFGELDSQGFSMLTSVSSKPMDSLFPISKQSNSFEGTSSPRMDFGLISTDSLLNSARNSSSGSINFGSSLEFNQQQSQALPLRHFFDDWPKNHTEDMQSDRTQLSISIPMVSSPNQDKLTLSPLKLSREFDPMPIGLGVGVSNEASQRQASWIPVAWESSMGGPLGEVLNNTNHSIPTEFSSKNYLSSSSFNFLINGCDSSPQVVSSPTGVLQRTAFGSLSSSTGSSPRAESHKAHDSINNSLCDDLLGSTLVNASTIPSL